MQTVKTLFTKGSSLFYAAFLCAVFPVIIITIVADAGTSPIASIPKSSELSFIVFYNPFNTQLNRENPKSCPLYLSKTGLFQLLQYHSE